MKKIPSLFVRNDHDRDRLVRDEVTPGAEWVIAGEGMATRKFDGTSCLWRNGKLWKRYDAKNGKTPPPSFVPAQDAPDAVTGHWPGWVPVGDGPDDRWHREALMLDEVAGTTGLADGTYELVGPKIQGNPERLQTHRLMPHGQWFMMNAPRTFDDLREWLSWHGIEGIVWHHPDGRMVKIKAKDFGLTRYAAETEVAA